jgi:hypothetical protein
LPKKITARGALFFVFFCVFIYKKAFLFLRISVNTSGEAGAHVFPDSAGVPDKKSAGMR